MFLSRILDKLEYKFRRYAIRNLMTIIVAGMGIVFVLNQLLYAFNINVSALLMFSKAAIMQGQVWRLITFAFIPPSSGLIFILLSLYFYWMIGSALESQWGSFRFNIFYFTGMLGNVLAGFITGWASNTYLNMSLFLAFAMLWPNFEVMLFFIIPVKMKYLAWIDAALLLLELIMGSWPMKVAIAVSMLNILLFFGKDFYNTLHNMYRRYKFKQATKRNWQ